MGNIVEWLRSFAGNTLPADQAMIHRAIVALEDLEKAKERLLQEVESLHACNAQQAEEITGFHSWTQLHYQLQEELKEARKHAVEVDAHNTDLRRKNEELYASCARANANAERLRKMLPLNLSPETQDAEESNTVDARRLAQEVQELQGDNERLHRMIAAEKRRAEKIQHGYEYAKQILDGVIDKLIAKATDVGRCDD